MPTRVALAAPLLALLSACQSQGALAANAASPAPTTRAAAAAETRSPTMKTFVKPSDTALQEKLTPIQYRVTQHEGTEPPFRNEYFDNH